MGKVATIMDVAREAGVSKTTAVFILNDRPGFQVAETTRSRVRDAAQRLGYRRSGLARAISTGRIYTVGVVIRITPTETTATPHGVYAKDVLSACAHACTKAGLRITLIPFPLEGTLAVEEVVDRRVDGLILVSLYDDMFSQQVYASGCPTVTIGSGYAERLIGLDQQGGVREATEHLLQLGHERVVHVLGENRGSRACEERRAGYEAAMQAAGMPPRCHSYQEAVGLLKRPVSERPTAIVAYNDGYAWQLSKTAREMGIRVPEELSLIGFDNNVLAETAFPPLTTVENPLDLQAQGALKALQCLWQGSEPPKATPLPTRLIVRQSTAAPYLSPLKESIQ